MLAGLENVFCIVVCYNISARQNQRRKNSERVGRDGQMEIKQLWAGDTCTPMPPPPPPPPPHTHTHTHTHSPLSFCGIAILVDWV